MDNPDGVSASGVPTPTLRPRRVALLAVIALTALTLDVVSKVLIVADVREGRPHRLIGSAVYLLLTRNSGAAFSIGAGGGATIVLTLIAVAVVAVIIRSARRLRSVGWAIALGLILGGALGNLVDRIFRAPGIGRGHVVDWISVFADDGHVWPIFNLADSSIVCGGVLAAIIALRGVDFDGARSTVTPQSSDKSQPRG
ncbi:MAG: lipoprotein signal peptidase [Pseudonocardiales bacterium]|nr:lipoprotein signal peptidase [Pseudonocardiales bacterium]